MRTTFGARKKDALLVTERLFKRILEYSANRKLLTSWYDHGQGVNRQYTLSYCLQTNYHQVPKKFYIARGGRHPPEQWFVGRYEAPRSSLNEAFLQPPLDVQREILRALKAETPDYDAVVRNIRRKYPDDILREYIAPKSGNADDFGS